MPSDRKLPNWIDAFLHYTNNTEPPYLYRKWTAISCIAAVMQRKCSIDWGTALTFYPNLYVVLVGPSATGKSYAMSAGLDLLHELSTVRMSAQATSLQALISHLKDTNLTDIDMATGDQIYHSSLTIFSKEFTVFLGYHNREMMTALCDWYDCDRKWVYDTISRKKEEIIGVWVNLLGGTTPDLIQSALPIESIGGGLTSRIIFIVEEKNEKIIPIPVQQPREKELFYFLLHDLEKISLISGKFQYTEGFSDLWTEWCFESQRNPPFHDPKFDGYMGRRRCHLLKLSMIMSAAHGQHNLVLSKDDLENAIKALTEAEVKMGTVFSGVGKSDVAGLIQKSTTFFLNSKTDEVPVWQFAQFFSGDMDKMMMDRVLATLEVSKIVKVINKPGTDNIIRILVPHGNEIVKKSNDLTAADEASQPHQENHQK